MKINADSQHPQVAFTTMDRQRISVAAHSGSSVTVDDKVETRDDPQQPHVAKVNTMWDVWGEHLFNAWPFMGLLVAEMRGLAVRWGFKESND
ncbi:hypothetical protein BURKHO8Y_70177 [Burkholderia sp. 8Y]|nr:hypothetical protein BURKHO8Y_70177 [Burkholderia sp. 8Y]